jgi:signal transduction histidine kinase/ligand-binding sensor domain-containing protein
VARLPHPVLVGLALACLAAPVAHAAAAAAAHPPADYTLRDWHEQDGLPSEEMAGVVQDRDGYLWVATNAGLARFDGHSFEQMEVPADGYTRVLALLADGGSRTGTPAIAANPRSADGASGYFRVKDRALEFVREEALAGKTTRALFLAPDGATWIGCEDGTVLRRGDATTTVFEPLADQAGRKTLAFAADTAGRVWLARGNRLFRADGAELREVPLARAEPELRLASSASGGIWVFTRGALLRWNGAALEEIMPLPELLGAHFVQAALEDSHGFLWVGTRSQGLFRIIGAEITPVPTSGENIAALCEDSEGNLWAATNGGGLSRLRPRAHKLYDQSSGLRDLFSYTVAEDTAGAIWLANRDGGMARVIDGVVDPVSRRAGWRPFSTMSVHPAPDGGVWITSGLGVFRTTAAAPETVERVTALNTLRNIRSTFVARNGDYWLAADPDRVARFRDGVLTTFGPEQGFEGREVRAFAEDADGRVWIGANDGRLFRTSGERLERVVLPGADNFGAIQVIRFEPDGTMLLGTTRYGVAIVPPGEPARTRLLFSDHGLPFNNITQILVDDQDRHWFASRSGVFWVHTRDVRDFVAGKVARVHAILLGRDDGLPYLTCLGLFQPAAWKARDGSLWFATRRGVLRTDPSLMASGVSSPPPVAITAITCDGLNQPLQSTLRIRSTVRRLQIRLSALNLSTPEAVQVRFRLDGFDNDWVVQAADRVATYPRLPPGSYVFSTMASNGTGTWSNQPAQLTIIVTPPWWQSTWAQALYLAALVGLVTVIVRARSHRRLRLRLERAEHARAIEQERARIARNIHDDVGASLTRISLLTQAALDESSAHSPTLEKIYESTRAITRSMDEIVWAVNPRHDNTESLVYYLGNFAQSFLGAAGIRCRLESPTHLPEATLTSQIRHHVFLGCKEALHNIVKHAGATEAVVHIALEAGILAIRITDNGRGIVASGDGAADDRTSAGDGLENMRQRMAEIRGTCSITREPSGGTTVVFSVPLDQAPAPLG